MSEVASRTAAGAGRSAPVRGTQSFVGVMAAVWKRPSLLGLELAWRWTFGVLALAGLWFFARNFVLTWVMKVPDMGPLLLRGQVVARSLTDLSAYLWPLVGGLAVWSVFAGVGRGWVLRRWDATLKARRGTMIVLAMLQAFVFSGLMVLWFALLIAMARKYVWTPMSSGLEPAYVPGFAMAVTATLLLFVVWTAVSWVLRIAPTLAMARGLGPMASLRAAFRIGALRGKLVEINLVMGIVKVALIVLAMVFSACPLPFSSVESQTFLTWWWIGVGVLYLVATDFFHVVRASAYERLYRLQEPAAE